MQKTKNYSLNMPEPEDYVIIGDLNFNTEEIDKLIKGINDALEILSTDGTSLKDLLAKKADLDDHKKVLIDQLPDLDVYKDVLMYNARGNFPGVGNDKKIYVDKSTNRIYRWTGSMYAELSEQLKIGEIKNTAFDAMAKRYTKKEVDELLASEIKKLKIEINNDILEQILAYS